MKQWLINVLSKRANHWPHKTKTSYHPFKALTICGRMVKFGSINENKELTCKNCIKSIRLNKLT